MTKQRADELRAERERLTRARLLWSDIGDYCAAHNAQQRIAVIDVILKQKVSIEEHK